MLLISYQLETASLVVGTSLSSYTGMHQLCGGFWHGNSENGMYFSWTFSRIRVKFSLEIMEIFKFRIKNNLAIVFLVKEATSALWYWVSKSHLHSGIES